MDDSTTREDGANLRLSLRRSVILRWWLLLAAAIAVVSASPLLGIELPQIPMLGVITLMAAFNVIVHLRAMTEQPVGAGELFGQLGVDLVALAILLYLSGGASNPLISFLLVSVAVAALSLPGRLTAIIAILAIAIYSVLMWSYLPLPMADAARAARLHLAGMWLTFVVSATMIAWFVARMTASIRERDARLAAIREQASRDDRLVALGALAAGAAHELGTPLATIAVIVGELEWDISLDAEARRDLAVVKEQIALCKGIISSLAERTGTRRPEHVEVVDARAWLENLLSRWKAMRPRAASRLELEGGSGVPLIVTETTLEQGLLNLLNNAADVSDGVVTVRLRWNENTLILLIEDQGPGFPAEVLRRGGHLPFASRHGGAGIGLLLAFSAVERLGGRVVLANAPGGGGRVSVELPVARRNES